MVTPCYEIEEFDAYRPAAKLAFAEALCSNAGSHTRIHNCLFMAQGVGKMREVKDAVIRSFFSSTTGGIVVFDLDLTLA